MNALVLALVFVAGVPTLVLMILLSLTQLRDEAVFQGWVSSTGRLAQQTQRAAEARVRRVLAVLGIDDRVRGELASTAQVAMTLTSPVDLGRLDLAVAMAIKPWIRELKGTQFRGLNWYVDTMGAVHHRGAHETSLAAILAAWIEQLVLRRFIPLPSILLVPKDGNPILAREAAERLPHRPGIIVVKGERDAARISTYGVAHETDFEGLEVCRATLTRAPASVLAVDDSCTSGRSLMSAIARYNEYVTEKNLQSELLPVSTAATLYCVQAGPDHAAAFTNSPHRVMLRSIMTLDNETMKILAQAHETDLETVVPRFKDKHSG